MNSSTPDTRTAVQIDVDGMATLGQTRHAMMGIRFGEGEGGNAPAGTPAATPAATPATPAAPAAAATPATPAATPAAKTYTPEETAAYVSRVNGEAKQAREAKEAAEAAAATAQAQTAAVLAALGIKADGSPADLTPEAIAASKDQADKERDATKRENLLLRVAPRLSANADKLLDSNKFTKKLAALKADDAAGVETLIQEFLEADASYKVAPAAAASSGGSSHTGATPTNQRKSMADAVAAGIKRN